MRLKSIKFLLPAALVVFATVMTACSSDSPTAPSAVQGPVDLPAPFDEPVVADFAITADGETLRVIFTNLSTGSPTRYRWDFGDGATSSAFEPVHTYREGSSYVVTLTASDAVSSDTLSQFVVFDPVAEPTASFTVTTNFETRTAVFRNTSSGDPSSFSWAFGDGATSREENPSHTYPNNGVNSFVATLTVSNSKGSNTVTGFVDFNPPPPTDG